MASSVSSERAFSAAGITISKRRNRLKADVVEALQFLKCLIRKELLFREPQPTSVLELELEVFDDDEDPDWIDADEPKSWDSLVINAEDSDIEE
jgi:hAT family C-terminal dimerisation region